MLSIFQNIFRFVFDIRFKRRKGSICSITTDYEKCHDQ